MPYQFTHAIHGLNVRDRLPEAGKKLLSAQEPYFLLGLYGPDVFFGDRLPPPLFTKHVKAVGNALHAVPGEVLFSALLPMVSGSDRGFAFAIGFLCHLALDNTLHPFIESRARGLDHTRLEMRQDLINRDASGRAELMRSPNAVYACGMAVKEGDRIVAGLVERTLGLRIPGAYARAYRKWRMSQALVYDPKGRKRRFLAFFERIAGLRRGTLSHMLLSPPDGEEDLFNAGRMPWAAPWEPERIRKESYGDLLGEATDLAAGWVRLAFECRAKGEYSPLAAELGERTMDGKNGKRVPTR